MIKKFLLIILFALCTPLILQGEQYELMRVAKIEIVPEDLPPGVAFNPTPIRAGLHIKMGSFFSQHDFDLDLKTLAEEYDHIEPLIEIINNEIYITLHLWFKPIIHEITLINNEKVSTKKIMKCLDLAPGSPFERACFINAFNKLKVLYLKKGYFEAEIDYEIIPVEGCNEVDIRINFCEGRAGKIKKICFTGLSSCEQDDIFEFMLTKKYDFLLSWCLGGGIYHPEMMEHDRMQITDYFQNLGYADAIVDICIVDVPGCDCIILQISVNKGILYRIGEISVCGNCLYDNARILACCAFGPNTYYSPEAIRRSIQAINDLYWACGYIDVVVDLQLSSRDDCPIYDIGLSLDEGDQYHVGLIKVFGNRVTHNSVILHETLLAPGDVFDNRRLKGTEARLLNTTFFNTVNVYAVRSQLEDPCQEKLYRDIYIEVDETDTGNLGLFFGLSSIDKIFGGVEISEKNFNLAGLARIFDRGPGALRGGGEYINAKITIGKKETNYLLQWTKPYFLDTPWIVGVEAEKTNNRAYSQGYAINTYGGSVHGTYIVNNYLKYALHYRAIHTDVDVRDRNSIELDRAAQQTGLISAVGASIIYDSTDHPRRASYGFRSRFMYEVAGVGGNYQFMKFTYLNSYYYPLHRRGTLKFRADLQFLKTYGSTTTEKVPLSERFFLGGETTVRGYRNFIIGPKFAPNEPAGGLSALLLSKEYQYNILKVPCLDGFVFMDAGYVSLSQFSLGKLAAAVGFGIRVEVMRNMPIMMGVGWPIHPTQKLNGREFNNAQRFFFAIGGTF